MVKKANMALESLFQDLWNELLLWDNDDVHINIVRAKLKKIQVKVYNELL